MVAAVNVILWVVFAIMTVSTGAFYFLASRKPSAERGMHYVTGAITLIAAISYYAMACDFGVVIVGTRPFYYARYIDWFLTTPLLLLDLMLLAKVDWTRTLLVIFLDVVMVLTGLFGGLTTQSYKWGFFVFGCFAYVGILVELIGPVRTKAATISQATGALFNQLAYWTLFLWSVYPLVWILGEGAGVIDLTAEVAIYAVLDVAAKAGFGFWLLSRHRDEDTKLAEVQGEDVKLAQAI